MAGFERVSAAAFAAAVAEGPASPTFQEEFDRYQPLLISGTGGYQIHNGTLNVAGDFCAPDYCTLILGDLVVDGRIDLANPLGYDEGGLFIVLGNVRCKAFNGHFGKCCFIDGDLEAEDLVINAYEDSSLLVVGSLKTFYFLGRDVWAEVGSGASMTYAQGFCLPIGYNEAPQQVIEAEHDEIESEDLVGFGDEEEPIDAAKAWAQVRRARAAMRH